MNSVETISGATTSVRTPLSTTVAVYTSRVAAEEAIRTLATDGFPLAQLSIIGKDFQSSERPLGFVDAASVASEGAAIGGATGGLVGLMLASALLVVPGIGPVIVGGQLIAALIGGVEGALAGAALGGLAGVLIGYGISREHVLRFETEIRAGRFLVVFRGGGDEAERASALLARHADSTSVFPTSEATAR